MKTKKIIIIFVALAALAAAAIFLFYRIGPSAPESTWEPEITPDALETATRIAATDGNATGTISNFEQCVAAGKKVDGEKPHRRCVVSDDLAYIEIETCKEPGGKTMNIFEARNIFDASKCAWEGSPEEPPVCDQKKGTWEIRILAYKKNCTGFCVIDIATKTTKIDWRCKNTEN